MAAAKAGNTSACSTDGEADPGVRPGGGGTRRPDGEGVPGAQRQPGPRAGLVLRKEDRPRFAARPAGYLRGRLLQPGQGAAAAVAVLALGELQDYVDEAPDDPWPGRRRTPPRPYAQVRGHRLYLWYGGPDLNTGVILRSERIPLADLQRSA